jgi:hypothetical protein
VVVEGEEDMVVHHRTISVPILVLVVVVDMEVHHREMTTEEDEDQEVPVHPIEADMLLDQDIENAKPCFKDYFGPLFLLNSKIIFACINSTSLEDDCFRINTVGVVDPTSSTFS